MTETICLRPSLGKVLGNLNFSRLRDRLSVEVSQMVLWLRDHRFLAARRSVTLLLSFICLIAFWFVCELFDLVAEPGRLLIIFTRKRFGEGFVECS